MVDIKNRLNGEIIASGDTIGEAIQNARGNLRYANLRSADLQSANLQYADLQSANLQYANLRYANLRSADLNDEKITQPPWLIWAPTSDGGYWIVITDTRAKASCECHSFEEWKGFDERRLLQMDNRRAVKYYPTLMALIAARELAFPKVEVEKKISE